MANTLLSSRIGSWVLDHVYTGVKRFIKFLSQLRTEQFWESQKSNSLPEKQPWYASWPYAINIYYFSSPPQQKLSPILENCWWRHPICIGQHRKAIVTCDVACFKTKNKYISKLAVFRIIRSLWFGGTVYGLRKILHLCLLLCCEEIEMAAMNQALTTLSSIFSSDFAHRLLSTVP